MNEQKAIMCVLVRICNTERFTDMVQVPVLQKGFTPC
jgi:hypothetical protein